MLDTGTSVVFTAILITMPRNNGGELRPLEPTKRTLNALAYIF